MNPPTPFVLMAKKIIIAHTESASAKKAADIPRAAAGRIARRNIPITIPRKKTAITVAMNSATISDRSTSPIKPAPGCRMVRIPAGTSATPIESSSAETGVGPAKTTLLGFSQGAIMALESTQQPVPLAGRVVAIAGRFSAPNEHDPSTAPNVTLPAPD